jgi:hypothetical protein
VFGSVYVFVEPDEGVDRVTFYLNGSVSPFHLEENVPFDLVGTLESGSGFAEPLETKSLPSGRHIVRAVLDMTDKSSLTVEADFTVAEPGG